MATRGELTQPLTAPHKYARFLRAILGAISGSTVDLKSICSPRLNRGSWRQSRSVLEQVPPDQDPRASQEDRAVRPQLLPLPSEREIVPWVPCKGQALLYDTIAVRPEDCRPGFIRRRSAGSLLGF